MNIPGREHIKLEAGDDYVERLFIGTPVTIIHRAQTGYTEFYVGEVPNRLAYGTDGPHHDMTYSGGVYGQRFSKWRPWQKSIACQIDDVGRKLVRKWIRKQAAAHEAIADMQEGCE